MSIPKRMKVNCSKCGEPLSVTVFESVNSDYADDIATQIMSGELFNVECPHCKFVSHLEYDILYHDLRHGAMIWVIHKGKPDYDKRVSMIRTSNMLPHITTRIVDDMNALKEKVSCLESNRDDRIIELCKVFTAYALLSQRQDFSFRNAFYTAIGGKELIYLYDNENNEFCCELSDKVYDHLKELYVGSQYAAQLEKNYSVVDYEWAESVFIPLIESEAKKMDLSEDDESILEPTNDAQRIEKKICPKCKATIPCDSEFCQCCGTKLSTLESETIHPEETKEDLLSEFEIMEIRGTHPVIIESAYLYCSVDREKYYLRCKFRSLTDKIISALMVDVFCMDVWGNELPTIRDAQILDLSPNRNDAFGFSRKIGINNVNTRKVRIKLKRIKYADGSIEECSGDEIRIPTPISLEKHFESNELTQQYIDETTNHASFVPVQIGGFWRCSCGIINTNTENNCVNCGCDKHIVFNALNKNFLAERQAAYIEKKRIEEENLKQKREQQRQEELERQRIAEIQKERNLSILKRNVATEAANKKRKIMIVIIIALAAILLLILIGNDIKKVLIMDRNEI